MQSILLCDHTMTGEIPLEHHPPCSTGWFNLFSHLTGLTKLSYERAEFNEINEYGPIEEMSDWSEVEDWSELEYLRDLPSEDWNRLYAALSKMTGLQELTMVNLNPSFRRFAEMPRKIGSLHQLRYITLDRSCAKLCYLFCPRIPFGAQIRP